MTTFERAAVGPITDEPTWLLMVYMQAGDNSNLDSLAVQDLIELQHAIQGTDDPKIPGNGHVVALVQMKRKWPDFPQRYVIRNGCAPETLPPSKFPNMATPDSLHDFLSEGLRIRARYRCLVLWGHNFGLGFGRQQGEAMTIDQLGGTLANHFTATNRLDLLATNSCTMAYIEAAFELKDSVRYLAASQVFMPAKGFPYRAIVSSIAAGTSPKQLGKTFVDEYVSSFTNSPDGEKVALSLLDLAGAANFDSLLKETADAIMAVIKRGEVPIPAKIRELQDVFMENPAGDARPVLDLNSLAKNLTNYCGDSLAPFEYLTRKASAAGQVDRLSRLQVDKHALDRLKDVGDQLDARTRSGESTVAHSMRAGETPVVVLEHQEQLRKGTRVLVVETQGQLTADTSAFLAELQEQLTGRTSAVLAELQEQLTGRTPALVIEHQEHPDLGPLGGVGVFAPFVVDGATRKQLELSSKEALNLYRKLKIFDCDHTKSWPSLVDDILRRDEPDEIVTAAGIVQVADRVQVNQMVSAVDAAFNTLDRVMTSSLGPLIESLSQRGSQTTKRLPFGPPRLRLAHDISMQPQKDGLPDLRVPERIVDTFIRVERALALVEMTVKNVMTNNTFGLGPPSKSDSGVFGAKSDAGPFGSKSDAGPFGSKSDAGPFGSKSDAGPFGSKSDAGPFGSKSDAGPFGSTDIGDQFGALTAFLSSDTQVAMLSLRVLFRALAIVLGNLEAAVSNIEITAAQCQLLQPALGTALSSEEYGQAIEQRFRRLFRIAGEAALDARRTARTVMAHPVYGLGRGPEDFGQSQRDQLAISAGLSRSQLTLL